MKRIPLTQGQVATVDDDDYDFLAQWQWQALKVRDKYYAVRYGGPGKLIYMHRVLMNERDPRVLIEHKNGQTLDNRHRNLRRTTRPASFKSHALRGKDGYRYQTPS